MLLRSFQSFEALGDDNGCSRFWARRGAAARTSFERMRMTRRSFASRISARTARASFCRVSWSVPKKIAQPRLPTKIGLRCSRCATTFECVEIRIPVRASAPNQGVMSSRTPGSERVRRSRESRFRNDSKGSAWAGRSERIDWSGSPKGRCGAGDIRRASQKVRLPSGV